MRDFAHPNAFDSRRVVVLFSSRKTQKHGENDKEKMEVKLNLRQVEKFELDRKPKLRDTLFEVPRPHPFVLTEGGTKAQRRAPPAGQTSPQPVPWPGEAVPYRRPPSKTDREVAPVSEVLCRPYVRAALSGVVGIPFE